MRVFYIPRDPRTTNLQFLKGHPEILKGIIDEKIWEETISEINLIMEESSQMDLVSLFYNMLVIPIFFMKHDTVEHNLFKYLRYRNHILIKFGVFICHPKASQYTELRCVMTVEK